MTDRFSNVLKSYAASLDVSLGQEKFATVASVNPANSTARVLLQPDNVLSGWLPVLSQWAGNGWGMICPPSPGDQVLVVPQEGNIEQGIIAGRCFSDKQAAPVAPVGEFWLVHQTGSFLKLCNDGTIRIGGDLHVQGDIYDRTGPLSGLRAHYNAHTHRVPPNSTSSSPTPTDPSQ
jgi:hypothetical protein